MNGGASQITGNYVHPRYRQGNDREGKTLSERNGLEFADLSRLVQGLIVTLDSEGSEVWGDGGKTPVEPVQASAVIDPTGCGDAYRAALLYEQEQARPLARRAALGSQLGALRIAQRGPQNYPVDRAMLGL